MPEGQRGDAPQTMPVLTKKRKIVLTNTAMKTAYATIKGIEVMRALRKGQASAFYYGDPLGEMRLVSRVFEM